MLPRVFIAAALVAEVLAAQASSSTGDLYGATIQPLLKSSCLPCHNGKVKQGGLDLSTREALLKGSEHGPVVVPGNANDSQLYKLVAHITEPGMPFKAKKLPEASVAAIAEWIKAGVPYGEANPEGDIAAEASKHWAFRVPVRPAVPAVKQARWSRNPIDSFIAAEHAKRGLPPLGEADRRTWLRRVYIDLIGLPPTPEQVRHFEADKSPAAHEKVVDELLASPRYGERWGRHRLHI